MINASINNVLTLGAKKGAPKNKQINYDNIEPKLANTESKFKSAGRKVLNWLRKMLIVGLCSAALIGGFGALYNHYNPYVEPNVPTTEQVYNNLDRLGIGQQIITKSDDGTITRYFSDGKPIQVGISDEFSPEEKQVIKECIDKYNDVFKVINPDYKFEIDDTLTKEEQADKNYVSVVPAGKLEGNTLAYESSYSHDAQKGYGYKTTYNTVHMGDASRKNIDMFRTTFLHEFMHALGVADAYLVVDFDEGTIMNATASDTKTNDLYKYDVAMLAALYGDFSNEENVQKMVDFINNYGKNSTYTDTSDYKVTSKPTITVVNSNSKQKVEDDENAMTF